MSELEENIKNLVSSPDALSSILSLVGGLTGRSDSTDEGSESIDSSPPQSLSPLSGIDPKIISAAMKIFGVYSAEDDRIKLLAALKPHIGEQRYERIDKATLILRLSKSIRAVMRDLPGGAENV